MAYNSQTGAVFSKKGGNKKFNFSGHELGISAYLKPEYDRSSKQCVIGRGTSKNLRGKADAASLFIDFTNSIPIGGVQPGLYDGKLRMVWTGYIESTDFFLDLKALAGKYQYCHLQVNTDPYASTNLLIASNVFLYLSLTSNYNGSPQVIYVDELIGDGLNPASSNKLSVMNSNVYIDLSKEKEAFLIPMIGFSGSNPYTFEIGDPKTDAVVEVDEV